MDAATALLGATLAEWQRKREEDAARRAAEYKERLANGRGSYREAAINYQRSLDNFKANLMKAGLTPQQAGALKSQAIVNGKIPSVAEAIASLKNDKSGGGGGKPMFAPAKTIGSDGIWVIIGIALTVTVIGLYFDAQRRHRVEGVCLPKSTLADCFNDKGRIEFTENQKISKEEFDEFLEAVRLDIDSQERDTNDWIRSDYDTPFYDGNRNINFPWTELKPDRTVCIAGFECSHQTSVNYVAQGMYSAASGQSLEDTIQLVNDWNWWAHLGSSATPEEIEWTTIGYNYYNEHK